MNNSTIKFVTVILLLAALPISSVVAGELSVIINGKSYHINSTFDWNDNNYSIGVEYEFRPESRWKKTVMANGFRDSNDDMPYMVGAGLHRRFFESDPFAGLYFDAGLTAFLMSREDVDNNKPFPGVLPSLRFDNRYAGINLT